MQAALGIHIRWPAQKIHIQRPTLPVGVESLGIHGLPVGDTNIDLQFRRIGTKVVVTR